MAKGPGFFIQPHTLPPGTGVEGYFGDDSATLPEDDVAFLCKAVEDDQAEIKKACINYFLAFFKAVDEEGKGVLVGDAFKTVIGKLEEDMPMEATRKKEQAQSDAAARVLLPAVGAAVRIAALIGRIRQACTVAVAVQRDDAAAS